MSENLTPPYEQQFGPDPLYSVPEQILPQAEEPNKLKGALQNVRYQVSEVLNAAVPAPVQKIIKHPAVRNRFEGVKGLIGATATAPLAPIGAIREGAKASLQVLTGKERVVAPPQEILRSTATGLKKTARGVIKMANPFGSMDQKKAALNEMAGGVQEVVKGSQNI